MTNPTSGSASDLGKGEAQVNSGLAPGRVNRQPWWKIGGKDYAFVSVDAGYPSSGSSSQTSLDIPDKSHNVWETSDVHDIYAPVERYENAHRFDPNFKWEPEEEKKLVRTLDWRIALPACIFFFALQLDRGNIVQALNGGMLADLGLDTNDYNSGMTIFYCSFLFAELPSQLISKKLGPDVWIPIQIVTWSIVAATQYHLDGRTSFFVTRCLLGLLEGGFIPDTILYLSYYYKHSELPVRLSWFWTSYQSTQAIGAFLAAGILRIPGQAWRDLFAIEGVITALIGLGAWFYMPASPTQTQRNGWRGLLRPKNGWFTERQEYILVTRVLLDDPNKATMHNRQGLSLGEMWKSFTDYDMWPIYLLGLTWGIPSSPPQAYITLSLKALGFSTFDVSLLTIPAYALFILQLLFWSWLSEKINQRLLLGVLSQLWFIPLLTALAVLPPVFEGSNWAKWAITTLIVGVSSTLTAHHNPR
jgi:hypothetical protein